MICSLDLPIAKHENLIIHTIRNNRVTLVVGDTGSGKSTQVAQYCYKAGYGLTVLGQPRRLAAKTVAKRIAVEMDVLLGTIVGYRLGNTGQDDDRVQSNETRILVCTNALALIEQLIQSGSSAAADVLILDEVHEWDISIEVLVGYIKRILNDFPNLRIVLMSATIEAEGLSAFFDNAPIINVEGRLFPIEDRARGFSVEDDVATLVKEGKNVLVFQPGEEEINDCIKKLKQMGVDAERIPLHSKLSSEEQDLAMASYDRCKVVVATNVAETSLTIPDIDAVVDTGLEKRSVVVNGIDALLTLPISLAQMKQRKGRAGRCRNGIYISHLELGPYDTQTEFPIPEIRRVRLDKMMLQLLEREIDLEIMDLFHQPNRQDLALAKQSLRITGCIDANGKVTDIGRKVARLPLGITTGRMIVEAIERGVLADVMTIVAILESQGIVDRKSEDWKDYTGNERESELLAQLSVFKALRDGHVKGNLKEQGILVGNWRRAQSCRSALFDSLKQDYRIDSTGDREQILICITAGLLGNVYVCGGGFLVGRRGIRNPNRVGIVSLLRGNLVVGIPREIPTIRDGIKSTFPIVTFLSRIKVNWLLELVGDKEAFGFRTSTQGTPEYDPVLDQVVIRQDLFLFGEALGQEQQVKCTDLPVAKRVFLDWLIETIFNTRSIVPQRLSKVIESIRSRNERFRDIKDRFPNFRYDIWNERILRPLLERQLGDACSVREIKDPESLYPEESLDTDVSEFLKLHPETINISGIGEKAIRYGVFGPEVDLEGQEWKSLKDETLILPSGSEIRIRVKLDENGGYTQLYTQYDQLIRLMSSRDCGDQYLNFIAKSENNMQRSLGDLQGEFPQIARVQYGVHFLTNELLLAYGVLEFSKITNLFEPTWFHYLEEATELWNKQNEIFSKLKKDELGKFSFVRQREGATNLSDVWVIREDGTTRACDKKSSDGTMCWDSFQSNELVLTWICPDKSNPTSSTFQVVQYPRAELTEKQIATVLRLETKEIKAPEGSFGLSAKQNDFLEEMRRKYLNCPLTGHKINWNPSNLYRLTSSSGCIVSSDKSILEFGQGLPLTTWTYGRPATILDTEIVAGKEIELLVFELENMWTLALRVKSR